MNEKTSESLKIINYVEIYTIEGVKCRQFIDINYFPEKPNQSILTIKNNLIGKSIL